jgi:cyclopropane fatty-acyl-phospholipid synthase-like methyltransferase
LKTIVDASVDFVWSFDTFVHIDEAELRSYVKEIYRVMKRHSSGCIHHPDKPDNKLSGARSAVTAKMFHKIFSDAGFFVIRQVDSWGSGCNVKLCGDMISVFVKP